MLHSKFVHPWGYPENSERVAAQISRLQDLSGDWAGNKEKQHEIGRDGVLGYKKGKATFTYAPKQFEYGSMAFWYLLANKEDPETGDDHFIDLDDVKSKRIAISTFCTNENDDFIGTFWSPRMRLGGFTINIGDPEAIVERSFNLVGEKYAMIRDNFVTYITDTVETGEDDKELLLVNPVEYKTDKYVLQVLRIRSGDVSAIYEGTGEDQYEYNSGTKVVTIHDCEIGDFVKVYYVTSDVLDTWENNEDDPDFLLAEYCEVYMKVGSGETERTYRLQTVGLDVSFDRTDYREIGNSEVVQTSSKAETVKITLDRFVENLTLEAILASNPALPLIDPDDFADNIKVLVKIFKDKEHTNFGIGYLATDLSPTAINNAQAVEDFAKRTTSLEGATLKISDLEGDLTL